MTSFNEMYAKMEDKFAEKLSKVDVSKSKGYNAVILYDVSGPNGGNFYINIDDGGASLVKDNHDNPNIILNILDTHLNDMLDDRLSSMSAIVTGKLKIKGDMKLMMKLKKVLA